MNRRFGIAVTIGLGAVTAGLAPGGALSAHAATPGGTAANGFTAPVELPQSTNLGEPSIVHDSGNRLFVTAPQAIGNVQSAGGSPLYTSGDGGATWSQPVRSQTCIGLSGGDTDLAVDSADNVYQTDLWLGNSCLSVSEDHGKSFTAGDPYGTQVQPGDDRPWIAYDALSNQNVATYDGVDAVHVANTAPIVNPLAGIQAVQDVPAVPESVVNSSATPSNVRACVCPPGGIAVDNSSGPHAGRVYISFSYQSGIAISYADVTGSCPACTISPNWSAPIAIPNSGTSGSAFENEWNMAPIKVDSKGTVYLMWGHAPSFDSTNNLAPKGVVEQYAYSNDGGNTWSSPITLSTESGTTVFPTLDVVAPGVIDTAWYGTSATGDPNAVPSTASWNVYYSRVTGANTKTPSLSGPTVAIAGMHTGCIQSGGGASCSDRSLLDFFQLTDTANGTANIIYAAGDVASGTNLFFTKLAGSPAATVAEAPMAGLLLVPAGIAVALEVRRRRGRAAG